MSARLQAIKDRTALAAAGPWELHDESKHGYQNGGLVGPRGELWGGYDGFMPDNETIDFIAHARTDIPALVKVVEATIGFVNATKEDGESKWFDVLIAVCQFDREAIKKQEEIRRING